jgi:hypothetical protein
LGNYLHDSIVNVAAIVAWPRCQNLKEVFEF